MDIAHLQRIHAELVLLDPSDHKELERLRDQTAYAFRQLFPDEPQLISRTENLRFPQLLGMYSQQFRDSQVDSMNRLKSIIETMIDLLKQQSIGITYQQMEEKTKYQDAIIKQHERAIEVYKIELQKADDQLNAAREKNSAMGASINALEDKAKSKEITTLAKNATFWTLVVSFMIGVPLWMFDRGKDFGSQKVDEERILLKDSVKVLNKSIDFMRSSSKSAHQLLGDMPYDELKLDSIQWRKVQTHIENVGYVLDTIARHRPSIRQD